MDWICAAGAYTGFPKGLADMLLERIPPHHSVCDLGCGVGLLDLALAPHVRRVTGIDQSAAALERLSALAAARGLDNMETYGADVDRLEGQWDTVLTTFFIGGPWLPHFLPLARTQVLAVLQEGDAPSFGPCHPPKKHTVAYTAQALDDQGVRYGLTRGVLEYGQPFRSRAEASDFILTYARGAPDGVEAYLDGTLEETGREDFPLYLPQKKRFGIFTLRREDNLHWVARGQQ